MVFLRADEGASGRRQCTGRAADRRPPRINRDELRGAQAQRGVNRRHARADAEQCVMPAYRNSFPLRLAIVSAAGLTSACGRIAEPATTPPAAPVIATAQAPVAPAVVAAAPETVSPPAATPARGIAELLPALELPQPLQSAACLAHTQA